jgi:syndecan 4
MRRQSALGVLLVVILVLLQVGGSTAVYTCTSDAHCKYSGCNNGFYGSTSCPGCSFGTTCSTFSGGSCCGTCGSDCGSSCSNPPVCVAGTYSSLGDGMNGGGDRSCQQCPPGKLSTVTGASSQSVCTDCIAGKYSPTSGSSVCTAVGLCRLSQLEVRLSLCARSTISSCESR